MLKTVCIDAGHGGSDSGAVTGSRYEKYDTLKFSNCLKNALMELGVDVIMTRTQDEYVSLSDRFEFAKINNADFFISIHRNVFTNHVENGVESWIYLKDDTGSQVYAQGIMSALKDVGIQSDRGVKCGNFQVTKQATIPSCLLELGFISNPKDNELFDRKIYQYAKAVAKVIALQLGFDGIDEIINENDNSDGASCRLYRVQVGSFKKQELANQVVEELMKQGYSAFVI